MSIRTAAAMPPDTYVTNVGLGKTVLRRDPTPETITRPRGDHRACDMQYVKLLSELAARRSQVRALRKLVRELGGTVPR